MPSSPPDLKLVRRSNSSPPSAVASSVDAGELRSPHSKARKVFLSCAANRTVFTESSSTLHPTGNQKLNPALLYRSFVSAASSCGVARVGVGVGVGVGVAV